MSPSPWASPAERPPEPGQRVDWQSAGGTQVYGGTFAGENTFPGGLWVTPGGIYVYYMPALWRPAREDWP